MKIYRMNDCDWCAGEDLESVKKFYMKYCGLDEDEAFDGLRELTEEEMDRLIFYDNNCYKDDSHRTFREELQRLIDLNQKFPLFFASTEY